MHLGLFDVFSVQEFSVVWRCKDKSGLSQIVRQDESIFRFVPENARKDENGRKKILEKRKPEKADISVRMSLDTVEQLLNKQIDPFKAFTTGKVKAKGNIFLALNLYKKFKGN